MKHAVFLVVVVCLCLGLAPGGARAQGIPPGFDYMWAATQTHEPITENCPGGENCPMHWILVGSAELRQGDTRFHADRIEYFEATHRMLATGHVQLTQVDSVIAAERAEYNTESQTGIFYNAWGVATIADRGDKALFGDLEPDVYFEGKTIEKIGPKKYRVTKGRFTTCVQPNPRWRITSGTVVISLEHYAVLTNPIIRVKDIPVFYMPVIYYPVKKEDRATGFLLPSYGTSSLTGFRLSNAFFWAIDRSQDLTLMHDWFKATGQGVGADYRYVRTAASRGELQVYMLDQHETTAADGTTTPASRSYQVRSDVNEVLSPHLRLGARVAYFTDLVTQQTYNTNINDASRGQRTINANLSGSWGTYSLGVSLNRGEYFSSATDSQLSGSFPQVSLSRNERPLGKLPIYFRIGGEFVTMQRGLTSADSSSSDSVTRLDVQPRIRIPFTTLPYFTVNSTVTWRGTFWTKSWDPANHGVLLDQSVSRQYFDFRSNIVGPVFNRVFDTPNSDYAEKLKHTIEPYMDLSYTTRVSEFDRIIQWDGSDGIVGGNMTATYGLNNRLYAKRKQNGVTGSSEILDMSVSQSYYTNSQASQFDQQYGTAYTGIAPSSFSPIAFTLRATPSNGVNATARAEIDSRFKILRTLSAGGSYGIGSWFRTTLTWNITRFITEDGLSDPTRLSHFIGGVTTLHRSDNHFGVNTSMNYDVHNAHFLQQRYTAYYNAQCCGFTFEYQTFDFGNLVGVPVRRDNRFNFSFTLAGIGSFSNFGGANSR